MQKSALEQPGLPRSAVHRRRGSAMTETVLVLPLLLVLLSLMFYFGRDTVRLQGATVLERYETWRHVAEAPGPQRDYPRNGELNDVFFLGRAAELDLDSERFFPADAPAALHAFSRAYDRDGSAGDYGEALYDRLPTGVRLETKVRFSESVALWQQLDGPIRRSHTRFGNDWRYVNGLERQGTDSGETQWVPVGSRVTNTHVLRDVFFEDLDDRLEAEANRDIGLAGAIRSFYLSHPSYRGPDLRVHGWNLAGGN